MYFGLWKYFLWWDYGCIYINYISRILLQYGCHVTHRGKLSGYTTVYCESTMSICTAQNCDYLSLLQCGSYSKFYERGWRLHTMPYIDQYFTLHHRILQIYFIISLTEQSNANNWPQTVSFSVANKLSDTPFPYPKWLCSHMLSQGLACSLGLFGALGQ